jgi:UDP:flavonoid glycosyltransferase YjiC (YdhE family)
MAEILWGACSQPGSLFPAVPIILELQRRGHVVTALCDPTSEPTFRALGCRFRVAARADAEPPPVRPATPATKADYLARCSGALFADTTETLAPGKVEVVLADALETGLSFAAEAAGVPCVSYVHWGMNECGPDIPFCFHLWDRREPAEVAFAAWWNGLRAAVGLGPDPRPVDQHRWYRTSPTLTLLLGLPQLVHPHGQLPASAVRVGPSLWEPPLAGPVPDWVAGLGEQRPAALAAISTIATTADADVLTTVAEAAADLDLDLAVTVPVEHDLPSLPGHVHLASFLPHGLLLDRVSVFVNHAGNGSVNRAACAGVPVLMLPTGRDQFQVAEGATTAGLGLTLHPGSRQLRHIRDALGEVANNTTFARNALNLAADARRYDAPREAADRIEALISARPV